MEKTIEELLNLKEENGGESLPILGENNLEEELMNAGKNKCGDLFDSFKKDTVEEIVKEMESPRAVFVHKRVVDGKVENFYE